MVDIKNLSQSGLANTSDTIRNSATSRSNSVIQFQTNKKTPKDTVQLTDTAMQIQHYIENLSEQPVIDMQKVINTAQAVKKGTLEIKPENIAHKLAVFEQQLQKAG